MYQDILATLDDKRDVTAAGLGGGALTVANSPNVSTSSYDTGIAGVPLPLGLGGTIGGPLIHDIGRGRRMVLDVQVVAPPIAGITTALFPLTSGGGATVKVDFISSAAQALTAPTVLLSTAAIPIATLVSGYRWRFGSTPAAIAQQFIGFQYTVGTADLTGGNISSLLLGTPDDHADILG